MTTIKERLHWVDISKGILIILLLLHHFSSVSRRLGIGEEQFWYVNSWQVIYTCFFMQAFFFLSGYCSNFCLTGKKFFSKLFKQLVIPLICFGTLDFLWTTYPQINYSFKDFTIIWLKTEGTSLWFLNALIFSKVVIWSCMKVNKSAFLYIFTSLLLLVLGVFLHSRNLGANYLCLRQSLVAVFFVAVGFFFKQKEDLVSCTKWGG